MAEQKNKSAEQLLSDLHQKRLEQALNEFNADKTRMAVGRLLEEYVDDGGQSYFDGAQKDATLYFVDDDYMDKVSDVEPQDENKPKKEKKGGFFAGALSKLAEKMKTEEPDDYEDEFPDEIEEYKDDKEDDVNLIDGTNKGFDMPAPEDLEPVAPIEEEEAVPPVKPSIFDTAKLSSMDLNDIEERLEKVHLKPATMEFADPDDVLKEILGETEEEKKEEPKEEIKPVKKENRKVHKKKDSLDDISVDDMGLGNIVNKIAEEELKNKEEKPEETSSVEEVETDDNSEVSVDTNTEDVQEIEEPETEIEAVEEEPVQEVATDEVEETSDVEDVASEDTEPIGESTITVTSVPEESINNVADEIEEHENHTEEDYPTKFKEKDDNKNTYVAEKTVILDKPLIDASEVISDDNLTRAEDNEAEETQPVSQEDNDMTKEEEVLNAITTETEAEVEEDVIPSRRRRFIEEKKKGKKNAEESVDEEIEDEDLEEDDEYEDDFEDTEDKPKKGLFGLFKKKKKKDEDEEDDFEDDDEEIEEDDDEVEDESGHNDKDKDEDYDDDEDFDDEDEEEDDYDDFDDEYRKGSGLKKFFIGALIVILVVAVTALAAMCYSYKSQLDSTREQLNKIAGNNTEETTALVEDITSEITTQEVTVATTEKVTESATTAVVSSGNNNTQAVQIVNSDGTSSNLTGATASGTTYTVKSGDTGEKICKSVYGEYTKENWSKILKANNMNESSTYHPGQELIIP